MAQRASKKFNSLKTKNNYLLSQNQNLSKELLQAQLELQSLRQSNLALEKIARSSQSEITSLGVEVVVLRRACENSALSEGKLMRKLKKFEKSVKIFGFFRKIRSKMCFLNCKYDN